MSKRLIGRVVELAQEALDKGSFPNGALIAKGEEVVCESISMSEQIFDPTAHAEMSVIREACSKLETKKLEGYTLYTSLEPCLMCFHASYWAGIRKIVYGAGRNKVSKFSFEGSWSSVDEAYKHTHEPVEIVYDRSNVARMVELHKRFEASLEQ